jgi:hypothetical protein
MCEAVVRGEAVQALEAVDECEAALKEQGRQAYLTIDVFQHT